jgi:cell wall-associated NlpC family hydrolase
LTQAAYAAAGIVLPRTAQTQYDAGPRVLSDTGPQPGDLVFFGSNSTHITHVGIVVTPGLMIDAPHRGATVRQERIPASAVAYTRPAGATPATAAVP